MRSKVESGRATGEYPNDIESASPAVNADGAPPQAGPELKGADDEGEAAPSDMGQQPGSTWPEAAELVWRDVGDERDGVGDQKVRAENNEKSRDKEAGRAPDEEAAVVQGFHSDSTA